MKKLNIISICIIIFAISGFGFYNFKKSKKLGYVTTSRVFDEFRLKKELEGDLKKAQLYKQSYLDSLKLKIQSMAVTTNLTKEDLTNIEAYKKMYLLKEEQFNQENELLFQQYNDKIWKQLNQYIEDFGRENNYDYVFGASGQGNIMYAAGQDNITEDVIKYVNDKYSGKITK